LRPGDLVSASAVAVLQAITSGLAPCASEIVASTAYFATVSADFDPKATVLYRKIQVVGIRDQPAVLKR
jgi:hypothetical protein